MYQQQQQKSSFLNLYDNTSRIVAGAISGILSRTFVAPIERMIILRQTKNPKYSSFTIPQALLIMQRTEGITSWFKGNWANSLRIAPYQAIEFFTFDFYRHIVQNIFEIEKGSKYQTFNMLFCGALAGMTAYSFVYPIDLAKTHLAIYTESGNKGSIVSILRNILQQEGFKGMYKGMSATLMGIAPYASLKLTFYQLLKNFYGKQPSNELNLLFGALSGCMAVTITYPTDLIRRRLQISQMKNNQMQVSVGSLFVKIIKNEGFFGLYVGLMATYLKIIPSTALAFAINEYLKNSFGIY